MERHFEGSLINTKENENKIELLKQGIIPEGIVEAVGYKTDDEKNLYFEFGDNVGIISKVDFYMSKDNSKIVAAYINKPVSFIVVGSFVTHTGAKIFNLSRKSAILKYIEETPKLAKFQMIPARICRVKPEMLFVDVGGGRTAVMRNEHICFAGLRDLNSYFHVGQIINVMVSAVTVERVYVTQVPMHGTFNQNSNYFSGGEVYTGIISASDPDLTFVGLAPNFVGVLEERIDLEPGTKVSVVIKSINRFNGKLKLMLSGEPVNSLFNILSVTPEFDVEGLEEDAWYYLKGAEGKTILLETETWKKIRK